MIRDNKFFVKKYDEDENKITLEEERKYHSPFVLFLIKNGRLLLAISLLLSVSVFIIAITLIFGNMKESSIVMYEQNGVVVSFDGDDNSIVNGTPITKEYAEKVFDNNLRGVVIKLKEVSIKDKNKGKVKGVITFYSDRTAIVKYDDGSYKRIYSVNGNYGITESGVIDSKAITNDLSGEYKKNDKCEKKKMRKSIILVVLGSVIYSFGVVWLLQLGGYFSGGVTGVSQLIVGLIEKFGGSTAIRGYIGLFVAIINIPLLMIGWRGVSKHFAILTVVSIAIQSILMSLISNVTVSPFIYLLSDGGNVGGGLIDAFKGDFNILHNPTTVALENAFRANMQPGTRLLLAIIGGLITDRYLTHSILEGMVFDDEKTSNSKNIILAASVSIPMTDLYIPFSIIITPDGKMTMERDEDMGDLPPLQGNGIN